MFKSFELLDFRQFISLILSKRFAVCKKLLNHNVLCRAVYILVIIGACLSRTRLRLLSRLSIFDESVILLYTILKSFIKLAIFILSNFL